MGKINQNANAPMNTLKPQPGQYDSYNPKFHPLPGPWAQEQMSKPRGIGGGMRTESNTTELKRALAAERSQHEYWENWQGVRPGKPVYEDPRAFQNTLLPTAKYGTEGRGYA